MLLNLNKINPNAEQVNRFLQGRMEAIEDGYINIFGSGKGLTPRYDFFKPCELAKALDYSVSLAAEGLDTYFNQSFLKHRPTKGRGASEDASAILGLWFDLDIYGPNHKEQALPTKEQAQSFINDEIPFRPSQTIWSGGGYQLHWLFSEPYLIRADKDLEDFRNLSSGFQQTIIAKGKDHGWKFDNTCDPARLLRIPGTINYKHEPVLVEVVK